MGGGGSKRWERIVRGDPEGWGGHHYPPPSASRPLGRHAACRYMPDERRLCLAEGEHSAATTRYVSPPPSRKQNTFSVSLETSRSFGARARAAVEGGFWDEACAGKGSRRTHVASFVHQSDRSITWV